MEWDVYFLLGISLAGIAVGIWDSRLPWNLK